MLVITRDSEVKVKNFLLKQFKEIYKTLGKGRSGELEVRGQIIQEERTEIRKAK
jgi:hypothetical protein